MRSPVVRKLLREDPVVVTGMGSLSAGASSPEALWELLRGGRSPARWFRGGEPVQGRPVAVCEVTEDPQTLLDYWPARRMDRCAQLGLLAAGQALADAGFSAGDRTGASFGVVAGTSRGGVGKWSEAVHSMGRRRVCPSLAVDTPIASLSGALSLAFDLHGPCQTVSATCSSGSLALLTGAQELALGNAEFILAGGAEAPISEPVLAQMRSAGMLGFGGDPTTICRPFDAERTGIVLGEAAAFLVLERQSTARARGARIHGILTGWAISADCHGRTTNHADGRGLRDCMREALDQAGLDDRAVDYVNVHGTSTRLNDGLESAAIRNFFSTPPPVSSTKPFTGHCLGATPALEAVIGLLALRHGWIPPTLNHHTPDPECDLDVVPNVGRPAELKAFLTNSLGFWGNQSSLLFERDGGR